MTKPLVAALAAAFLLALPGVAQTASELLQKGIYAQETEGNLDNAILIYRQIVNSAPAQREIAAQAQYRLAQSLLQKGDLTEASREFERLARDYADYGNLVSSLAGQIRPAPAGGRGGRGGLASPQAIAERQAKAAELKAQLAKLQARLADLRTKNAEGHPDVLAVQAQMEGLKRELSAFDLPEVCNQPDFVSNQQFDPATRISVTGRVSQVLWMNPQTCLRVDATGGTYTFALAAPNSLVRTGTTRATLQLGMEVTVTGILANFGSHTGRADTISSEGKVIFNRATLPPAPVFTPYGRTTN